MRKILCAALIVGLGATPIFAKVKEVSLEKLIRKSYLIVKAKVEKIEILEYVVHVAKAKVETVFKGDIQPSNHVQFISSWWLCMDGCKVEEGEIVILFLEKMPNNTVALGKATRREAQKQKIYLLSDERAGVLNFEKLKGGEMVQLSSLPRRKDVNISTVPKSHTVEGKTYTYDAHYISEKELARFIKTEIEKKK